MALVMPPVVPELASTQNAPQGSPTWWANKLHDELRRRQPDIELHRRYADGDSDNPTIEERASRAFQRIVGLSKTNLSGLIIEATAERLAIQGFRFGDEPTADSEAWKIWQASDFDGESELLIGESLTVGRSFVMVEPPGLFDKYPRLYAEDASQMVLAYAPGRRTERLAGWKEWQDEWTGDVFANLFLPDGIYKLRARNPGPSTPGVAQTLSWRFRDELTQVEANPLGEVPIWEVPNRPKLSPSDVRSEISDVLTDQDACNHIALNALIAAEYGAFRQKWMTGIDIPRDPLTGKAVEPFDVAVNRLLVSENAESRFGDFNATDLKPYIELYESRVKHMAAVSRTPVAMLLGGMVNISAEALALSVAGLVQKVKRKTRYIEQPFESALRACFTLMNDPRGSADIAETIWVDPEIRSAAQQADAAVKLVSGDVISAQTAQELYLGMTETQRSRDDAWRSQNSSMLQLADVLSRQQQPALTARQLIDGDDGDTAADTGATAR